MESEIVPVLKRESDKWIYKLSDRLTTIGAAPQNKIVINGQEYPPHIAHIIYAEGCWQLTILNRYPVIIVNGKPTVETVKLNHGDVIKIGKEIYVFTIGLTSSQEERVQIDGNPLRKFVAALARFSRSGDSDVRFELLAGIAQLLKADGARLVSGKNKGAFSTIARYPESSGLDRFSERAIIWAKEQGKTILMHDTDWVQARESNGSLEFNKVKSVLCCPLFEGNVPLGFLYLDRQMENTPFTEDDKHVLEDVRSVFSDLLTLYDSAERQRETIERLQKSIEQSETSIIYECNAMQNAIDRAARYAATDSPILITGETGTGKELFARFIHRHSNRKDKEFCAINCGALPENLIESELFGYEKGAFTGAHQNKEGLLKRANGGTVFLDEIGEMPFALQVKLLRVLQEGEITPVGAIAALQVDIRIIAATNRNLQNDIQKGLFREDLYYRLNVLNVHVPALRDRHRDVLPLTEYLIQKYAVRFGTNKKRLSVQAKAQLLKYRWPGNIRQLENVIQKALLNSHGKIISEQDFDLPFSPQSSEKITDKFDTDDESIITLKEARCKVEKLYIQRALRRAGGNVSVASRLLDIDRKWLTKLIKHYGFEYKNGIVREIDMQPEISASSIMQ